MYTKMKVVIWKDEATTSCNYVGLVCTIYAAEVLYA